MSFFLDKIFKHESVQAHLGQEFQENPELISWRIVAIINELATENAPALDGRVTQLFRALKDLKVFSFESLAKPGRFPLLFCLPDAVDHGAHELALKLIDTGAKVSRMVYHTALQKGFRDVAAPYDQIGYPPPNDEGQPYWSRKLIFACETGIVSTASRALENGAKFRHEENPHPLETAVKSRSVAVALLLIQWGTPITTLSSWGAHQAKSLNKLSQSVSASAREAFCLWSIQNEYYSEPLERWVVHHRLRVAIDNNLAESVVLRLIPKPADVSELVKIKLSANRLPDAAAKYGPVVLESLLAIIRNKPHKSIGLSMGLYAALKAGREENAQLLLDAGAKLILEESAKENHLVAAAASGMIPMLKLMFKDPEQISDAVVQEAFSAAWKSGQEQAVLYLREQRDVDLEPGFVCDIHRYGMLQLLQEAFAAANEAKKRELLEGTFCVANVDDLWKPLAWACRKGWLPIAEFLLAQGAEVGRSLEGIDQDRFPGMNPVVSAVMSGNPNVVLLVLEHLKTKLPDSTERADYLKSTEVYYRLSGETFDNGQFDIAICLVREGVDPRRINRRKSSGLQAAVASGRGDVVSVFIEAVPQDERYAYFEQIMSSENAEKRTPLALAYEGAHWDIVQVLAEARLPDVATGDLLDEDCLKIQLHCAVVHEDKERFTALLNKQPLEAIRIGHELAFDGFAAALLNKEITKLFLLDPIEYFVRDLPLPDAFFEAGSFAGKKVADHRMIAENTSFFVRREVIHARSALCDPLFTGISEFKRLSAEELKMMIHFLYTGRIDITSENFLKLAETAACYGIPKLHQRLKRWLKDGRPEHADWFAELDRLDPA